MGRTLPYRMDLQGRLTGWHRFKDGNDWVRGRESIKRLPVDKPLSFVVIPNTLVWVQIEIHQGGSVQQVTTQVGSATPAYSLKDALMVQFQLNSNAWSLWYGEHKMEAYDILSDFDSPFDTMNSLCLKMDEG